MDSNYASERKTKPRKPAAKPKRPISPSEFEGALLSPQMTGLPMNIFIPRKPKGSKKKEAFLLVEASADAPKR